VQRQFTPSIEGLMNGIFVLVPIMVLGIAVAAIVSSSLLKLQRLRLEQAKLAAGNAGDMNDLVHQVAALQHELADVQERLDFTERMLAQVRERPGLPAVPRPREPS
jgi:Tfp pilus assembly protein PilO